MWRIGLTGSIASGKTTILEAFAAEDVPVFSADKAVHELYAGPAVSAVEKLFPQAIVDGAVDREKLGAQVLQDPAHLKSLEALIHPMVRQRIADFFNSAEEDGAALAVVEVPLLFESGHDYGFDAIAVTVVDEATQRQRALARPGMTVEKLNAILARQLPQDQKRQRATYLFDSAGTIKQNQEMVAALVAAIRARQAKP
ncbi:dephospho-CoA kinase [Devosia rhodophyticola]|uniref:Dephospho-CoA kinase n=1 Tax=Devosia rhodophyticola TaxID=3026423 RepID=A0ABY7Z272_9HYPH|nr:dephospho-CoA kinase [Devosia rhodophyticola]WDR07378.1 dephospho-CoA kinase [Devosia rhodophyticola]